MPSFLACTIVRNKQIKFNLKRWLYRYFSMALATHLVLLLSLSAMAEVPVGPPPKPCNGLYAKLSEGSKNFGEYWQASKLALSRDKLKNMAGQATLTNAAKAAKATPKFLYNITLKEAVADYKAIATTGSWKTRPARLAKRIFLAPRARETDPRLRDKELAKVQWLSILNDPVLDGGLEVLSKLKQRFGPKIGISSKPLESNLSIPASALLAAYGIGTFPYLNNQISSEREHNVLENFETQSAGGGLGTAYLNQWVKLGFIDGKQAAARLDDHSHQLMSWLSNISSKNPQRPLPPRLLQLILFGAIKSEKEARELEEIALRSMQAAEAKSKAGLPSINDEKLKKSIIANLTKSQLFSDRSPGEMQILAKVLDPVIFLDGDQSNDWVTKISQKDGEWFVQNRAKASDTLWMLALLGKSSDGRVNEMAKTFREAPSGLDASKLVAIANFSMSPPPESSEEEANRWLPEAHRGDLNIPDTVYLPEGPGTAAQLIDSEGNVETLSEPVAFDGPDGNRYRLSRVSDILEVLNTHPFFIDQIQPWRTSTTPMRREEFSGLRQQVIDLDLLLFRHKDSAKERGEESAKLPSIADICFLRKWNSSYRKFIQSYTAGLTDENKAVCTHYLSMVYWSYAIFTQKKYSPDNDGSYLNQYRGILDKNAKEQMVDCTKPSEAEAVSNSYGVPRNKYIDSLSCN